MLQGSSGNEAGHAGLKWRSLPWLLAVGILSLHLRKVSFFDTLRMCKDVNAAFAAQSRTPGDFAHALHIYLHTFTLCLYKRFAMSYLQMYERDLKSAGLYRPWGFKSPSGHHIINNLQDICENRRLRNLALVILLVILCT